MAVTNAMDAAAPKMDDLAASQQLLEEQTYSQTPANKARGGRTTPSSRKTRPTRLPPPFIPLPATTMHSSVASSPADAVMLHDSAPPTHAIEVPDSQAAPTTDPDHTLMSPPMTSSFAAPGSMSQATPCRKSKRNKRAKLNRSNSELNQEFVLSQQDTVNGVLESPSSSLTLSGQRRRSYATEPVRGTTKSPQVPPLDNAEGSSSAPLPTEVATTASASPLRMKKKLLRTLSAPDPIEDDDVSLVERSERAETMLRELKKAKPGKQKRKSVEMDDSAAAEDSISEAAEEATLSGSARRHTAQTPKTTKGTRKEPSTASGKLSSIKKGKGKAVLSQPKIAGRTRSSRTMDGFELSAASQPVFDTDEGLKMDTVPGLDKEHDAEDQHVEDRDAEEDLFVGAEGDSQAEASSQKKVAKPQKESKKSRRESLVAPDSNKYLRKNPVDRSFSAAQKALNDIRDLPIKPETRTIGEFTADEDELIRRAIRGYQQDHNFEVSDIVEIIQWTDRSKNNRSSAVHEKEEQDEDNAKDSHNLWHEIQQSCPNRPMAKLKGHVRTKYNSFATGAWSKSEDEQLIKLQEDGSSLWKEFAEIMNRSPLDVFNRWNDYLQYGDGLRNGRWSDEEENLFIEAIKTVVQRHEDGRAAAGEPRHRIYSKKDIKWKDVCAEMGGTRSRVQCEHKWRVLSKRGHVVDFQPVYREREESMIEAAPKDGDVASSSSKKKKKKKKTGKSKKPTEDEGDATPSLKAKKGSKVKPKKLKTAQKGKERQSTNSKDEAADAVPGEVVEDDVPQDEAPQDDAPQDNTLTGDALQDDSTEDGTPTNGELPNGIAQDNILQDANLQDDVPQEETTEENMSDDVIPATAPEGLISSLAFQSALPGVAQMRWGDKLDLLEAVASGSSENEEDIDWHAVVAELNGSWSVRTLQRALKQLLRLVPNQGKVADTAFAVVEHLFEIHSPETLKEHFVTNDTVGAQPNEHAGHGVEHREVATAPAQPDEDAGPGAEQEVVTTGPKPKAGGKRKRDPQGNRSASRVAARKKTKGGAARHKSAVIIPMSDDSN
jgi:hypothetical protein